MRFLIWPFLVLILLGIQSTWFRLFNSAQAPDLLLIFVLVYSLDAGGKNGAICGFCIGALQDILTLSLFGFHSITRLLVGLFVGASRGSVFKDRPTTFVMLVGITSIIIKVVYTIVLMLLIGRFSIFPFCLLIQENIYCGIYFVLCRCGLFTM